MRQPLGILEVKTLTLSMLALDAMEKAGECRVLQAELNDLGGLIIKCEGPVAALRAGLEAAKALVERFKGECLTHLIASPAEAGWKGAWGPPEFSPLMEANVVFFPEYQAVKPTKQNEGTVMAETNMSAKPQASPGTSKPGAIGFIETQGYTAVIEAIDTAVKAANVEVLGREKLGGGFITVVIQGDVAAVEAAIAAGKEKVEGLGKLIAAHVIARPSEGVVALLPKA